MSKSVMANPCSEEECDGQSTIVMIDANISTTMDKSGYWKLKLQLQSSRNTSVILIKFVAKLCAFFSNENSCAVAKMLAFLSNDSSNA